MHAAKSATVAPWGGGPERPPRRVRTLAEELARLQRGVALLFPIIIQPIERQRHAGLVVQLEGDGHGIIRRERRADDAHRAPGPEVGGQRATRAAGRGRDGITMQAVLMKVMVVPMRLERLRARGACSHAAPRCALRGAARGPRTPTTIGWQRWLPRPAFSAAGRGTGSASATARRKNSSSKSGSWAFARCGRAARCT